MLLRLDHQEHHYPPPPKAHSWRGALIMRSDTGTALAVTATERKVSVPDHYKLCRELATVLEKSLGSAGRHRHCPGCAVVTYDPVDPAQVAFCSSRNYMWSDIQVALHKVGRTSVYYFMSQR